MNNCGICLFSEFQTYSDKNKIDCLRYQTQVYPKVPKHCPGFIDKRKYLDCLEERGFNYKRNWKIEPGFDSEWVNPYVYLNGERCVLAPI
jgi:hypothetical protein